MDREQLMSPPRFRLQDFPDLRTVFATEGGAVYAANRGGKLYLIVDESILSELLGEDEMGAADSLVHVYEFATEAGREAYSDERGWNRRRRGAHKLPPYDMSNE